MESIVKKIPFSVLDDCEIRCLMVEDEPWFNSIDLCDALGFRDENDKQKSKNKRAQALRVHVHDDDKTNFETLLSTVKVYINPNLDGNVGQIIYVNESGLFSLAFGRRSLLRGYLNVGSQARCSPQSAKKVFTVAIMSIGAMIRNWGTTR
jgi:hypothetical protein